MAGRACVQCTLLCEDAAAKCCSLCGGALATAFRSLKGSACIDLDDDSPGDCDGGPPPPAPAKGGEPENNRACPRCTLISTSDDFENCEACGAELQPPRKRPKTVATGQGSERSQRSAGLAGFFGKAPKGPSRVPSAALPSEEPPLPAPAEPPPDVANQATSLAQPGATWSATATEELGKPCESFSHQRVTAGLPAVKGVPYRVLAVALDALEATKSRLSKDTILTNAFRALLAMSASVEEVAASCYLFAPAKDAQSGGHRLRPDWAEGKPLSIPHKSITASLLEATGSTKAEMNRLYHELHDTGEVALALRDAGGRQKLLKKPAPLTAGSVRKALLALSELSGQGVERAKTAKLGALLRAAEGTELKWLARTFLPHMAAGISLEASVLPALGSAVLWQRARPSAEALRAVQEEVRHGYALRPDVHALVEALLRGGVEAVRESCTLQLGVPMQPMLAKACTSVEELLKRTLNSMPEKASATLAAEFKYDGQRAQIHVLENGTVKIFSRKLDDMTYKYPDVVSVVKRSQKTKAACVLDAEIVAVVPKAEAGQEAGSQVDIAAFQSLSTRKRKNVTEQNTAVAVKVFLFDLLYFQESLIALPFGKRREKLQQHFEKLEDLLAFAEAEDLKIAEGKAEAVLEAALHRSVAASCEGLMVKHLDSIYEPSTKRSDCWLKLKKDYLDSMGDSLDLVPIGGWRGSGRKSRWISPWLMATYDPTDGTLGSVCRVMSGFSDKFYKENTIRYVGHELDGTRDKEEAQEEGEGEEASEEQEVVLRAQKTTRNLEGDQNLTDNSTAREEPGAQEKWMKATCTEAVYLVLIMPFAGLSLALIYEQMKKASQSLFGKKDVRTDEMSKEMREEWMQDAQNQQKMKLNEYLTDKEQDGLGGILQMVVTEVAGMSSAKWVTTQCMSLSLYHFIVTEPVESNVCVLGKTGRLMYLMRKPLNPSSESARLLSSAGMMIILLTAVALVYFRSIERMLYLAMNFPSPGVEARLMLVKPIAVLIDGKVHLYTFLVAAVLWLFNLVFFKATIKSWGHSDAKNYYESDNACCAQYFRSGTKSSPFAKPRRVGGMRIFFGPYPMSNLFWELGANWNFLRCLEPLARLPLEYDNGGYPSGGGSPSGPDDTAGFLQLVLGLMNSFLGTLGLFFFGVNIYNLLINIQNCPTSTALAPCIVQGTCAHVARAPWFAHYIVSNKLMLAEDLAKEAIKADIPIKEIAKWLGVETVGAAKQIIMEVAETSCNDMYAELITGPNDTVHGMASDWLGKRHAEYYLEQVENRNLNITWQAKMYSCHGCVRCMTLHYFTDIQNVVELIEIFLLIIASYMSALLAQMMGNQLENCPMIDVTFEADPTQKQTVDLHETEKSCLGMIARTFFFRYHYCGVPKHMEYLEEGLRKEEKKGNRDTKKLSDPFQIVENAKTWDDYNLFDATAVRRFNVHRELLGLLEGEEVLSAWTVPPRLTRRQKLAIAFGVLFFIVGPIITALRKRTASCGAEALLGMVLCWKYVDFFVLKRRPQAGLVLSTRRVFQVTKTPRYLGLMGYSEPLIKMDVLVHNCSISYAQLQMETAVPFTRKVLAKVFGLPLSRCGQVIAQSPTGIFKMWRELGDTYNLLNYVSQACYLTPLASLNPKMGKVLMYNEKVAGEQDPPDPGGSKICCPNTPPPPMMGNPKASILDRYVKRIKGEVNIYGRKLVTRPSRCKDLFCGKGFTIACECCCCCQLDELLTEFMVSSHRILVEQRAAQRYCRATAFLRKVPSIRVTFLAHNQAAAYVNLMPVKTLNRKKIQQDFTVKLLQKGAREYQQGLMLHQKPYVIAMKKDLPIKTKVWVPHINMIFDQLTQRAPMHEESSGVEDDSDEEEYLATM